MYCDLLTISTWGHPSPLRHADVLNGWSLRKICLGLPVIISFIEFGLITDVKDFVVYNLLHGHVKVRFFLHCMQWPIIPLKNLTSLFPLTFLSKHISLYALGRLKWILDIIWPLNQHFKLKNQRNWLKQVSMLKFWIVLNRFLMQWTKKLTLQYLQLIQLCWAFMTK